MSKELVLVAASGLAREVAESARRAGWDVLGCLDDNPELVGTEVMPGLPVLGLVASVAEYADASLLLCAGKGATRQVLAERLRDLGVSDERYAVMVDPMVTVPPSCTVGGGSVLLAGTVLTASVTVGRHVVCMPHVVLTHDDVVEDYATLCAGVVLGGGVTIGTGAYLGMTASVRERTAVGAHSVLAMGAVLVSELPKNGVWGGLPATSLGSMSA